MIWVIDTCVVIDLVRIGRNPTRYVGVKNGEKRYYVLEGDTLKPISAEEAIAK